jgi:succinyl-diaminopimelate desuccinylase
MRDLLQLAAELVDIVSVSRNEAALADRVEGELRRHAFFDVERAGDTVVARTDFRRAQRLLLAGHLDTVPPFDGAVARVDGDTLSGLGAVDMKGGLAVLLSLASDLEQAALDGTFVFYACEEIERDADALAVMASTRPEALEADAAVLAEPTGGVVEAGCQGTLRAVLRYGGRRAHTARPWQGVNAVHRLAPALDTLQVYEPRQVTLEGCTYTEQLQAVRVEGGLVGNVVPDSAALTVNYRFAPDRDEAAAEAELRRLLGDTLGDDPGDTLEIVDVAPGALPGLSHPLLAALVGASGVEPRAKVGWTDVATLCGIGVPAANFGPGDPQLAHTPDERVTRAELDHARAVLAAVLGVPTPGGTPTPLR